MRATLLALFFTVFIAVPASAVDMPLIPNSARVLTLDEVKNYWVNRLPHSTEPSRLSRNYHRLIVDHHKQIGERHRLVQAIRAGKYDRLAKMMMLEHNIYAYLLKHDKAKVAALTPELAKLQAIVQAERKEQAEIDRIERLIAATERLAAAIEKNAGVIPANAQHLADEIIPFERDRDRNRRTVTHVYDDIEICDVPPIIVHHDHHKHSHKPKASKSSGKYVHPPNSYPQGDPRGRAARNHPTGNPAKIITPQVIRPNPPRSHPIPARQPQVRPATAPRQPQVRQPQVRPAR